MIAGVQSPTFAIANVRCSYASAGDVVDLTTGAIAVAEGKTPTAGRETAAAPFESTNVFNSPDMVLPSVSSSEFVLQAASLFNATQVASEGASFEASPVTYAVRMTKDAGSLAFQGLRAFNGTTLSYTSYVGLKVDMYAL